MMSYIDGSVAPVEPGKRQEFVEHSTRLDQYFLDNGALRIVETWSDDLPDGKLTDFRKSVQASPDEAVIFSWIEWPDKATRDATFGKMMADPTMAAIDMPFDGKRMIIGGFAPLVDKRGNGAPGYADGFVVPVPAEKQAAYSAMAESAWPIFAEHGAVRHVEAWGDDVPDGEVTDFKRAVQAKDGERIVFSFIEWPDKATRDAAWPKLMADERMAPPAGGDMPFDGARMFWGGFQQVLELKK